MSESTPLTNRESTQQYTDVKDGECKPTRLNMLVRIKDARKKSTGPFDFMGKFFSIILDTVGFLILAGVILAIPITMIAIGAINLKDCPAEPYVPIWILISGSVVVFQQLIFILRSGIGFEYIKSVDDVKTNKLYAVFNIVLLLFNLCWFIAGNVWVFLKYPPNIVDPSNTDYCEPGVYYFSFALIIATYAWIFFMLCFSGCVAVIGIKDIAHRDSDISTGEQGETSHSEIKE